MEIIFVIYKSFFFSFLDVIILWTFLNIQKFKFTALIFTQQLAHRCCEEEMRTGNHIKLKSWVKLTAPTLKCKGDEVKF